MYRRRMRVWHSAVALSLFIALFLVACGADDSRNPDSVDAGSGGSDANGGSGGRATGGSKTTGGKPGAGGATSNGGVANGGAANGGATSSGGASSGGKSSGGTTGAGGSNGGTDAGPDASESGGASSPIGDAATDGDAAAICDFGTAASFATQQQLDLFGTTVYFGGGEALPAGKYRLTYVDGCMKYASDQDWTIHAYANGGSAAWWIVGATSSERIVVPPGTVGYSSANGAYATFDACVAANQALPPVEFDFPGGKLGVWLLDTQYTDNLAGVDGRNPKWNLSLLGACRDR
jgi:hypothetical protein